MITAFYVVHAALAILLGVFLIVRLFSAIFSERIRSQIGKHLGLHVFLVVACVFLIMPYRNPNYYGPPYWMVRREERQQVFERVEAAGGWSALRAACTNLVVQAKEEPGGYLYWRRGATNALPPAFTALQPQLVEVSQDKDATPVVFIKFFGGWSTGARYTPSYSLHVRCGPTPQGFEPEIFQRGNTVIGKSRLLTDSIFEIY